MISGYAAAAAAGTPNAAPSSGAPGAPAAGAPPSVASSAPAAAGGVAAGPSAIRTPAGLDTSTCKSLYVGNLDPRVEEGLLQELFKSVGAVANYKIIRNRVTGESQCYGFVDFEDHDSASKAMDMLDGRKLYDRELKINWAYAGASGHRDDGGIAGATSTGIAGTAGPHHNLFVGDLSPEVDDDTLYKAFSVFGSICDARVMWDQATKRSRGFGFVAFREKEHAEMALAKMNGQWLGSRNIRVNWANQKQNTRQQQPASPQHPHAASSSSTQFGASQQDYWTVFQQSAYTNTVVYCGNLPHDGSSEDLLRSHFSRCGGSVLEVRLQADKGFGFLKMDSHEAATNAILYMNGTLFNGRPIKCGWGRDRTAAAATGVPQPPQQQPPPYGYGYQGYPPYPGAYQGYGGYAYGQQSSQAGGSDQSGSNEAAGGASWPAQPPQQSVAPPVPSQQGGNAGGDPSNSSFAPYPPYSYAYGYHPGYYAGYGYNPGQQGPPGGAPAHHMQGAGPGGNDSAPQ